MKFFEVLQDPKGDYSSKRLFGLGCFVFAVVFGFMREPVISGSFLGAAIAVFITQAATKT